MRFRHRCSASCRGSSLCAGTGPGPEDVMRLGISDRHHDPPLLGGVLRVASEVCPNEIGGNDGRQFRKKSWRVTLFHLSLKRLSALEAKMRQRQFSAW